MTKKVENAAAVTTVTIVLETETEAYKNRVRAEAVGRVRSVVGGIDYLPTVDDRDPFQSVEEEASSRAATLPRIRQEEQEAS